MNTPGEIPVRPVDAIGRLHAAAISAFRVMKR